MDFRREIDWALAFKTLLALLLVSQLGLGLGRVNIWRHLGRLELVDRPLLADHQLAFGRHSDSQALILGDSVMYGSALREHGIKAWREQSLGEALGRGLGKRGYKTIELSSDGLFPADLHSLLERYQGQGKAPIILELNYRMLCAEAGDTMSAYSRSFLAPESVQPDDAEDRLAKFFLLFRYCRLASHLLWQPSRIQVLDAAMDRVLPPKSSEDPDVADALFNLKIQPYYQAPAMTSAHAGLQALQAIAVMLKQSGAPVLVFMTPQNMERIEDVLDAQAYHANLQEVAHTFVSEGLKYRDWSARKPLKGTFLDHCHLDAMGNEELAQWILQELPR